MFGIGETELIIIVVFAFMIFGPDKLPGMGRTIGRALRQFREAQEGFTQVVQAEVVDPLTGAMNEPSARRRAKAAEAAAEDADLEGTDEVPRRQETFAERKARLEAERKAREDAERKANPASDDVAVPAVDPDDDGDLDMVDASPRSDDPAVERPPATDAASLYALAPRHVAERAADAAGPTSPDPAPTTGAGATDGKEAAGAAE